MICRIEHRCYRCRGKNDFVLPTHSEVIQVSLHKRYFYCAKWKSISDRLFVDLVGFRDTNCDLQVHL